MSDVLMIENISKTFYAGKIKTEALKSVSFSLKDGELLAVMGSSGSGKSTLLHILGGLETCDEGGHIYYKSTGDSIRELSLDEPNVTDYRRKNLGFVFQRFNLLSDLSVKDNILLPLLINNTNYQEGRMRVAEIAKRVGLSGKLNNRPSELSGGQQQRVAIARALISKPKILLADEPTGALDYSTAMDILSLFCRMNKEMEQSTILVTHDPTVASFANRVIFLHDGEKIAEYFNKDGVDNVSQILEVFKNIVEVNKIRKSDIIEKTK